MAKLTKAQRRVLEQLKPCFLLVTGRSTVRMMDGLAMRGLVKVGGSINNIVFRYDITPAGLEALKESSHV